MRVRTAILCGGALAALSLAAQSAAAQTDSSILDRLARGAYVGLGAGANVQEENRFRGGGADTTASYNPGFAGTLSYGYALGNGLRLELEPGYRYNDLHSISGAAGGGRTQVLSVMANAIYDIDIHTPIIPFVPHVGLGAGWAHIWNQSGPHNGLTVRGHDNVPAFQAIGGLEYALQPHLLVGVDYRYFLAHDADFRVQSTGLTTRAGDFNDHTILLTLRYEFGAPRAAPIPAAAAAPPPPPPPPVPQAAPAAPPPPVQQAFQIYFDLNSARLTQTARSVVQQAAVKARQGQVTRLTVSGHTDTTGAARYNQRLSERRADAVKAELVRDGVPADEIVTVGQGEQGLAVPTAAGVNEPRNRRVEIVLQSPGS